MRITITLDEDTVKAIKETHEEYLNGKTDDEFAAFSYTQNWIETTLDVSHDITKAVIDNFNLPDFRED